jgi:hypothetical protein
VQYSVLQSESGSEGQGCGGGSSPGTAAAGLAFAVLQMVPPGRPPPRQHPPGAIFRVVKVVGAACRAQDAQHTWLAAVGKQPAVGARHAHGDGLRRCAPGCGPWRRRSRKRRLWGCAWGRALNGGGVGGMRRGSLGRRHQGGRVAGGRGVTSRGGFGGRRLGSWWLGWPGVDRSPRAAGPTVAGVEEDGKLL